MTTTIKYYLIGLTLYFCHLTLFAQIPYATQQPKWSMRIFAKDATGKKDTAYKIDVSSLAEGIYFIKVETSEGIEIKKIIIQR